MIQKCKIYFKKVMIFFLLKIEKFKIPKRTAYEKAVVMVTSNLIDKDLLHQIVPW